MPPDGIMMDSAAARGMAKREGVGKVKGLEVKTLWLQQEVKRRRLNVRAVPTDDNYADLGTKVLANDRLHYLRRQCGLLLPGETKWKGRQIRSGGYHDDVLSYETRSYAAVAAETSRVAAATTSTSTSSSGGARQQALMTFRQRVAATGIALITLAKGVDGGDVCRNGPSEAYSSCAVCHSTLGILMLFSLLVGCWAGATAMQPRTGRSSERHRASKCKAVDMDMLQHDHEYVNALLRGGPRKRGQDALQYRTLNG